MGMDQTVTFVKGAAPSWPQVRDLLQRHGFPVQMRMIDGELGLPDEIPPETWRELRLGTALGMVTVRRESGHVVLVTWGNADLALRQAWNALAWAFAEVGGGRVQTQEKQYTSAEFQQRAELPQALQCSLPERP